MADSETIVGTILDKTGTGKVFTYPGSPPAKLYREVQESSAELVQGVREQHLLHMAQTRYYRKLEEGEPEIPVVIVSGEMGEAMVSQPLIAGSISAPILLVVAEPRFGHEGNAQNIAHQSSRAKTPEKVEDDVLANHDNVVDRTLLCNCSETGVIEEMIEKIEKEKDVGVLHVPVYSHSDVDESFVDCMKPETETIEADQLEEEFEDSLKSAFIVGRGCKESETRQKVAEAADQMGAVITTTWQMDGYFEDNFAGSVGICGVPAANEAVMQADKVLAIGTSLQNLLTSFNPEIINEFKSKTVQIDPNPRRKCLFAEKWVQTEAQNALEALENVEGDHWFEFDGYGLDRLREEIPENIRAIGQVVREEYSEKVVNMGVGNSVVWLPHVLGPGVRKETSRIGSMGESVAGLNREDNPLIVLGDGELEMDLSLITEAQYVDNGATIVVVNNQRLGLVTERQENSFGEILTPKQNPIDYKNLADGFNGVEGHTPVTAEDVRKTLRYCLESDQIDIVEVKVEERMSQEIWKPGDLPRLD
jgi:thiamine pyrophosphate-dependent acetolactate synthase large subunit-like protein